MEQPINILIVDDEPKNLTVLETILADPGYRLVRAESADKALLALVAEEFALLILDIRMPEMTGFELAQIIKQRRKTARVPIIFLTAYYNEDQHVLEGYDVGAVDYLHKPVNTAILRSKVAIFAELYRNQRECALANRSLLTEVTQRRRAEEQLRELNETLDRRVTERTDALRSSEARLSSILQNVSASIYEMDAACRFVHINRHFEESFGLKADEVRGKSVYDVFPQEIAAAYEANNRLVLSGRVPVEAEEVAPQADGLHTYVSIKVPRLDADGRAVGIVGISTDITERKASEEARARLAAIIESSDDAILSKDLNGVITTWNAGAERLFGYTAQEAVGQPVTMLIPPGHFGEEPGFLQRFRRGERVENYETVRRHKSGTLLDVSLTISPVLDGQGRIVGASKIARDITARKLAEAQARQSAEELRASHDELERFNRLMVERELRMVELKKEVNQFCAHAGQPPRYPLDFGKEQP